MNEPAHNLDPREVRHFENVAARWWDPNGEMGPLHVINPVRAEYVATRCGGLSGRNVLDVGCGGGLLSESLAALGASVTGIDAGGTAVKVARLHGLESGIPVDYERATAEAWADRHAERYDVVCCMEMLEHVPEPLSVIRACARLARPGGDLFFSTLNRTPQAFALAILGAEYVLGALPRGTHHYDKFIRPAELAGWLREAGLDWLDAKGLYYNPITGTARRGARLDINYIVHARRPETT